VCCASGQSACHHEYWPGLGPDLADGVESPQQPQSILPLLNIAMAHPAPAPPSNDLLYEEIVSTPPHRPPPPPPGATIGETQAGELAVASGSNAGESLYGVVEDLPPDPRPPRPPRAFGASEPSAAAASVAGRHGVARGSKATQGEAPIEMTVNPAYDDITAFKVGDFAGSSSQPFLKPYCCPPIGTLQLI